MLLQRLVQVVLRPRQTLAEAAQAPAQPAELVIQIALLALIPTFCGYLATAVVGWDLGVGTPFKLPLLTAGYVAVAAYVAFNVGVYGMGFAIYWLAQTFSVRPDPLKCLELAVLTSLPLFLSGFMALYPLLYVDITVGMFAVAASLYLLYTGVPIFMEIPQEAGFIYSTWIAALGLIMLVAFIGVSVFIFTGLT
ncbi:MAG TPA: Yip1 family protein [Gammaproteobacteria bacterium]